MEQTEINEKSTERSRSTERSSNINDAPVIVPSLSSHSETILTPQINRRSCPTCGNVARSNFSGAETTIFVYALGRIEARFPNLASEKEFAQATGRTDTAGKTDQQAFHEVLSQRENRYLMRQICWVLSIQGLDTYLLLPRDPADIDLLVEAIRPVSSPNDIDAVIGMRGPIAPPQMCNGLMVPIVIFDQIYSFTRVELIKSIPRPEKGSKEFAATAEELLERVIQLTDNAGATDEHRALNYLSMRYPAIYSKAAEQFTLDFSLNGVEVRPSPLSSTRKIVDVIYAYTNRKTDFTEKVFVRVDVTEEFPFLLTKMSPYYDREIGGGR